uniref:Tyrosine-specific transport protein n=1 Tax=Zea mays TaxID=4577 RepID=A0A804Q867_MAIZE
MLLSGRHHCHHKFTPSSPPAAFRSTHLRRLRPLRPLALASANPPPPPSPLPSLFPSPRRPWRWRHSASDVIEDLPPVEADGNDAVKVKKSFWAAVSLIIGTAVGPGMLGLPSATIRSGQAPSAVCILLSWAYVVSSIVLVAELSFAAMARDGVDEVSFTGLASSTLGAGPGAVVAVVYAALSFSLLVACVAGIGSLVSQLFPGIS